MLFETLILTFRLEPPPQDRLIRFFYTFYTTAHLRSLMSAIQGSDDPQRRPVEVPSNAFRVLVTGFGVSIVQQGHYSLLFATGIL